MALEPWWQGDFLITGGKYISRIMVCRVKEVTAREVNMACSINVALLLKTHQWFPIALEIKSTCFFLPHRTSPIVAPSTSVASWLPILPYFQSSISYIYHACSHLLPFALVILLPAILSLMPLCDVVLFRHMSQFIYLKKPP